MWCRVYWLKIIIVTKLLILENIWTFNIDIENPILITNHFDHSESHFGASVVLLKMRQDEKNSNSPTGWIFIGAPKANSSHENHGDLTEPGVIWRCSLGWNQMEDNDCRQLWIDPTSSDFDPKNRRYAHKDYKNGGWLGGAMSGHSDRFVACASRWVNRKFMVLENEPHFFMNGICYWVPSSTLLETTPNETWPSLPMSPNYSYRLLPLVNRTRQTIITDNSTVHYWSYGQAGFSLHLTDKNELLLGAPGIDDFSGSVIQYIDSATPSSEYKRFNSGNEKEFSEVWVAQSIQTKGGQTFEYFGYAVTSGHFFETENGQTQYAASAPRANSLSGKVYVFSLRKLTDSSSTDVGIDLLCSPIVGGNWRSGIGSLFYASYFGSVLCAVDINNDQFDELIVGAPLYSIVEDSDPDSMFSDQANGDSENQNEDFTFDNPFEHFHDERIIGDEGCAFVFFSDGKRFKINHRQILCGDKVPGSRFGSAISSIGDLNKDNFKDVAIGAPYEGGRGAVYIYHGSSTGLILAQKLLPQDVHDGIRGFGISISLGVDIDNNLYPDLAIGCYQSNQVVIYRTIPLVNMRGQLNTSLKELWADVDMFNVTSCVSFDGISLPSVLRFQVTIILDKVRQGRLVEWIKTDSYNNNSFEWVDVQKNNLTYLAEFNSSQTCFNLTARRIRVETLNNSPVKISQLNLRSSVKIEQEIRLQSSDSLPVKTKLIHYEMYRKENGQPAVNFNETKADFTDLSRRIPLEMTKQKSVVSMLLPISNLCQGRGQAERICVANFSLSVAFQSVSGLVYKSHDKTSPYIIGSTDKLIMEIKLHNQGEIANLPIHIKISWSHALVVNKAGSECKKITNLNQNNSQSDLVECSLRRPLKTNDTEKLELEFDMKDMFVGQARSSYSFHLSADTSSNLTAQASFTAAFFTSYQTELILHYSEEPKEVPYLVNLLTGTVNVQQEYGLNLKGPSSVYSIQLEFRLPSSIEIDGEMQPLTENWSVTIEGMNLDRTRCHVHVDDDEAMSVTSSEEWGLENDDEKLKKIKITSQQQENSNNHSTHIMDRIKKLNLFSFLSRKKPSGQILINCTLNTVKCKLIKCPVVKHFKVKDYASFLLRFRVFSRTAESFEDVEGLAIQSDVRARVFSESQQFVDTIQTCGRSVSLLRIPPRFAEIPIWIIIASALIGMTLLTLIVFLLTKCGFFRRRNKESLDMLRRQFKVSERFSVDDVDGRYYDDDCHRDMRFD